MKCHEVMDYMQRYQDGDINDLEQAEMRKHMRECTSCAEMFERLNRLSDELVNLPKITPPFSIVDSILPQLEEIDRTARAKRPHRLAGGWNTFKKSVSLRALGGLAAACVILALVIVQGPSMLGSDQSANDDALMDSANSGNKESADTADQFSVMFSTSESADDAGPANQEQENAAEERSMKSADEPVEAPAEEPADNGVRGFGSTADNSGNEGTGQAGGGSTGAEGGSVITENPTVVSRESNDEADYEVTTEEQPAVDPEQKDQDDKAMGFTSNLIANVAVSPDGLLEAYVEKTADGLQVIVADQQQERIYASPLKKADAVSELVWSEDGATLTYKVTTGDAIETYTIDIATRSEKQN